MGIKLNLLNKKKYLPMVEKSYRGLRSSGLKTTDGPYLIPTKVSGGTCVGDENYYLTRKLTDGTGFGYGSFIMFGLAYEEYKRKN